VALTHEHADFDAIASLVGLARLRRGVVPVLPIAVNHNVRDFLTLFGGQLPLVARDELRGGPVRRVWLVDTAAAQMVKGVRADTPRSVIDHHPGAPAAAAAPAAIVAEAVGATATLIVERLAKRDVQLPKIEATLLLLGIYEDTGHLTYVGTTPRDLRAAAWLLERGADLETAHRFLFEAATRAERELAAALTDDARMLRVAGHTIAIAEATAADYEGEIAPVASRLLEQLHADALFAVVELGGSIQVVARSRTDALDVGAVTAAFGGGGHARAAAAVLEGGDRRDVGRRIADLLPSHVRPAHTVGEIMTRGPVRTLDAARTIAAARDFALRHGHEGYPVLDDGRLVGVVTRPEIDGAIRHGLAGEPLRRLVSGATPVVTPATGIDELQERMLETHLGQLPVTDGGALIGIVTRTDLLKLWAGDARPAAGAPRVDLDAVLPAATMAAVRAVAAAAAATGVSAYLVGGVPRDLLLGASPEADIDVVVEGDAIAVGRAAAATSGGRVTAHARFGTASWTSPGPSGAVRIDLVSARTEFYAAPSMLPGVERGSLRSDLRRRDFTINTLAIDLTPGERFGRVIDLFGARRDLHAGEIRVLHSLSFIEDPTRILRALRFAARLGFGLEERTARHLAEAMPLLKRVSSARLRSELLLVFGEREPTRALRGFEAAGALAAIAADLTVGARVERLLEVLPAAWARWAAARPDLMLAEPPAAIDRLVLWLADQRDPQRAVQRLGLPGSAARAVATVHGLWAAGGAAGLAAPPAPALFAQLEPIPPRTVLLAWLGADEPVRRNLGHYLAALAHDRPTIRGEDIMALGVPPGPRVGAILKAVHAARLDGHVRGREQELALARRLAPGSDPP
jgi:tRNA nucleotidyltransferase (CCA-adding enzyme)